MTGVGDVYVTRSINCDGTGLIQISTCGRDTITIKDWRTCPSDCSDNASLHCYFSDTIIVSVSNVDITQSVKINRKGEP